MAVKLRLKRMGRSNAAFFRLNAIEGRSPRDGRVIEELGYYDPRNKDKEKQFVAKIDRCQYWLSVGAVPSETVSSPPARWCSSRRPATPVSRSP